MLSLSAPFFFCAVFSFIGLVCAIFWLQDYNTKSQKKSLKCLPNTVLKDNASDDESALLCVNENVLRMETDLHMEEDAKENSKNTAKVKKRNTSLTLIFKNIFCLDSNCNLDGLLHIFFDLNGIFRLYICIVCN